MGGGWPSPHNPLADGARHGCVNVTRPRRTRLSRRASQGQRGPRRKEKRTRRPQAGAPDCFRARGERLKNMGIFGDTFPKPQCLRAFACFFIPKLRLKIPKLLHLFPNFTVFFPSRIFHFSLLLLFSFLYKTKKKKKKKAFFMHKRYPHAVRVVTECIPKFSGLIWGNLGMIAAASHCFYWQSYFIPNQSPHSK